MSRSAVCAQQQVVVQLTMLEPRMVSRVICELKRHQPEDRSTWVKCVVRTHSTPCAGRVQARGLRVVEHTVNCLQPVGLPTVPAPLAAMSL